MALLLGLGLLGVWRVFSDSQDLPFDTSATPPPSVAVTKGDTYQLAVPGGVRAMLARGVPTRTVGDQQVLALQCTWSVPGGIGATPLTVLAESTTTKAENVVATFTVPVTGHIRVSCSGWGTMFVPDSNDRPYDWAGTALLAATILLMIGSALGLAELHRAWERSRENALSPVPVGQDDQVE